MSIQSLQHDYEKALLRLSVGLARSSSRPDFVRSSFNCAFSVFASLSTNKAGTPCCRPQPFGVGQRGTLLDPLVPQLRKYLCTEGALVVCIRVGAFYCKEALSNRLSFPSSNSWRKRVSWIQKWRPKLS